MFANSDLHTFLKSSIRPIRRISTQSSRTIVVKTRVHLVRTRRTSLAELFGQITNFSPNSHFDVFSTTMLVWHFAKDRTTSTIRIAKMRFTFDVGDDEGTRFFFQLCNLTSVFVNEVFLSNRFVVSCYLLNIRLCSNVLLLYEVF